MPSSEHVTKALDVLRSLPSNMQETGGLIVVLGTIRDELDRIATALERRTAVPEGTASAAPIVNAPLYGDGVPSAARRKERLLERLRWHVLVCNDPACNGRAIVSGACLNEAIAKAEGRSPETGTDLERAVMAARRSR